MCSFTYRQINRENLANKLSTVGGTSAILTRIQAANEIKNYINALVLDGNEEYEQKQMTFNGLAEVMNQNRIGVAAALRMPLTKLFGMSAAGFNTGESDLENYNQFVESEIRAKLNPVIRKLLRITMAQKFGYVPSFTFKWPAMRQLSAQEEEAVNTSKSNITLNWFDRGLLTSEEAMQQAKRDGVITVDTKAEDGMLDDFPSPPGGEDSVEPISVENNLFTKKDD